MAKTELSKPNQLLPSFCISKKLDSSGGDFLELETLDMECSYSKRHFNHCVKGLLHDSFLLSWLSQIICVFKPTFSQQNNNKLFNFFRVSGFNSQLCFWSSFLLILALGGSRWCLRYSGPCQPHGVLGSQPQHWPGADTPAISGIKYQMDDLSHPLHYAFKYIKYI